MPLTIQRRSRHYRVNVSHSVMGEGWIVGGANGRHHSSFLQAQSHSIWLQPAQLVVSYSKRAVMVLAWAFSLNRRMSHSPEGRRGRVKLVGVGVTSSFLGFLRSALVAVRVCQAKSCLLIDRDWSEISERKGAEGPVQAFTLASSSAASRFASAPLVLPTSSCSLVDIPARRATLRTFGTVELPMAGTQVRATSWSHLHELLFEDSWNDGIQRHRSKHAFRGLPDIGYDLQTTLMRLGGQYHLLEKHLLRNFQKYAHQDVVERDSVWHWLSVAQHHGLPTRLLDWTYSPQIALHFLTANYRSFNNADGVIWKVDFEKVHALLPDKVKRPMQREGSGVFTVDLLAESLDSLEELDGLSSPSGDFAIFFEPPSIDNRIVNQFAYFSVMSNPRLSMDCWLKAHPDLWCQIVVPKDLKWEIRDKLDQSNITERVLFPGLDGLCAWLQRHYSPRT